MSTPSEKVRIFLLQLNHFLIVIDGAPSFSTVMLNTINQLRDALCAHQIALSELVYLENTELDAKKRYPLSQSLDRGMQTNAMITKFISDYCADGYLGGLFKHRMQAAVLSDIIVKAADQQQMAIHAYKMANGWL